MAKLGIDFQDGLENDDVVVRVDGRELFRRSGMNTKRVLGLAGSNRYDVDDRTVSVDVSVPSRGIEHRFDVDATNDVYVGVSLAKDGIRTIVSGKPFGYG